MSHFVLVSVQGSIHWVRGLSGLLPMGQQDKTIADPDLITRELPTIDPRFVTALMMNG